MLVSVGTQHGVCKVNKDTRCQYEYTRTAFDPRVAGRKIRERIAEVYGDLATASGSAGRSRYT